MRDFETAITTDYRALLTMLVGGGEGIRRQARAASDSGDSEVCEIAKVAMTLQLEGFVLALNSHVDSIIQSCHGASMPSVTVGDTRLQREDRLKSLECQFGFERAMLLGWEAVTLTNDQANALKHRSGFTLKTGEGGGTLSIASLVHLEENELLARVDDVHSWTLALGRSVGTISSAA